MVDSESNARFLVKQFMTTSPLYLLCLDVVVDLVIKLPRLQTSQARSWAIKHIPPPVREAIIRKVTVDWAGREVRRGMVQKVWAVLYSHQQVRVELPAGLEDSARSSIMTYLGMGHSHSSATPTTNLILLAPPTLEETQHVICFIHHSHRLTVVHVRRGGTDDIMEQIGKSCPSLKELAMTGSAHVTDSGVSRLLGINYHLGSPSPCCKSLQLVKVRGTKIRCPGIKLLIHHCPSLRGIRCSTSDVLGALASHLKADKNHILSMRFMDFSSYFSLFQPYLAQMPCLQEVRAGADTPPSLKHKSPKYGGQWECSKEELGQALASLIGLPKLTCLILKDVEEDQVMMTLELCGKSLTRLDLHYLPRGVNICSISHFANSLTHLAISDSMVTYHEEPSHPTAQFLPCLQSARLMRVQYEGNAISLLMKKCRHLRLLDVEAGDDLTNELVEDVVNKGGLDLCEEVVVRGTCGLGEAAVRAFLGLSNLKHIGDLQDWKLSRKMRKKITKSMGTKWSWRMKQPKMWDFYKIGLDRDDMECFMDV